MLGTTALIPSIIVPILGGGHEEKARMIQTLLFVSGLSTLLQSWFGTRLPVVMGGSYAFLAPAISASYRFRTEEPHLRFTYCMRAIQGALLVASVFQILIAVFLIPTFGRLLSPLTAIPLVTLVGLGMFVYGFPQLGTCAVVGVPTLLVLFSISQCLPHIVSISREEPFNRFRYLRYWRLKPNQIQRYALLFLVPFAWPFAAVLSVAYGHTHSICRVHLSGLFSGAHGLWIPNPFQWGSPTLDVGDAVTMMMAVLVATFEGIGTLLGGVFGVGTGSTALVENAGLLGLTRYGSRRAVQVAAAIMILFSILGKFAAFLASLSLPLVGAVYCLLYSYVVSGGMSFIQFCNPNSIRVHFIVGSSLFLGIAVPSYWHESLLPSGVGSSWWSCTIQVFCSSSALGAVAAIVMDYIVIRGNQSLRVDSGRDWWAPLRNNGDINTVSFYSFLKKVEGLLPCLKLERE
ncbi:nucleobase-ascorbate transporter 4-like [Prunus yedoensis var. nudiflora]|uniref:Nucleobase-ascorbate transporter 4-like n=1 Tax=Prunus yedoensis var. nudiflora TaxID=2094558 RepID=A0A314ZBX4_PRUYE|nr:nucleobase-ascorbate transporter 4-like [Prunus yedoensis var. nudiflora]